MKHRKITFIPGTLGRFIRKYDVSFHYLEVYPEMICRKRDHPGQKFFILTLNRPGVVLKMPYTQGAGVRTWPTIEGSLEMLVYDMNLYLRAPEFNDFAREMMDMTQDIEDIEREYEILKSLTERARAFFGEQGFQELITLGEMGFEMEGDRTWPKRTCG